MYIHHIFLSIQMIKYVIAFLLLLVSQVQALTTYNMMIVSNPVSISTSPAYT